MVVPAQMFALRRQTRHVLLEPVIHQDASLMAVTITNQIDRPRCVGGMFHNGFQTHLPK